jgi:uncharacterized repeat protein (TIGR01451 family)
MSKEHIATKIGLLIFILGLTISFSSHTFAAETWSYGLTETSGFQEGVTIQDQGDKIIHYHLINTNHGSDPITVEKFAFVDPVANFDVALDNEDDNLFTVTGQTVYQPEQTDSSDFYYDTTQENCGRVQIDAGFRDPDGASIIHGIRYTLFIGVVINYGVNCYVHVNTPPTLTLVGANPVNLIVGQNFTDPGATAFDQEDGDITANIVKTGGVNTGVAGTYSITYNVSDSQGLAATPVSRTVNVLPDVPTVNLTANPATGTSPLSTVLTWTTNNNPTSCVASNGWNGLKNVDGGSETISNLTSPTTFTIVCSNVSGTSFSSVTVNPNHPPVITLVGANPINLIVGQNFTDPGATAFDQEDGDITANIVKTGGVNTAVAGTYTITYNVSDSQGLAAVPVSRTVNVVLNVPTVNLSANPTTGTAPLSTVLTWTTLNNPTSCVASNGWNGLKNVNGGSETISNLSTTTVFTISCSNPSGVSTSSVTVTPTVVVPVNHPPVITLIGANPASVIIGDVYTDPGATAFDQEDGDITSHIIASSTVNTNVVGSYTVTYNVSDSQGLAATPVSRTVNVLERQQTPKGKITFCLMIADSHNNIIATSTGLPSGSFILDLASSTNLNNSGIESQIWNSTSFHPNRTIISGNDADCVSFTDLELGTYYYSEVSVNGSLWNPAKYNDQDTQSINNVFDFFPYSPELFNATTSDDSLRDVNADGQITLASGNQDRTLVVLLKFKEAPQCVLPSITSSLTSSVTVNEPFSYVLTATSTEQLSIDLSTLPAGLSFATSTNTISGTVTSTGTFHISLKAENSCASDTETLVLTVNPPSNGGGGPTPSANLSVAKTSDRTTLNVGDTLNYTLTVANAGPDLATSVNLKDILPSTLDFISATSTLGSYSTTTSMWTIGNLANGSSTTLTITAKVKTGTEGVKITNSAQVSGSQSDSNPSDNNSSVDVNVNNPAPIVSGGGGGGGGGGGNGPIVGSLSSGGGSIPSTPTVLGESTPPSSCYYLRDYLRRDFNNDPSEVTKLQLFLRDLEGFSNLPITAIYDDATIAATDVFQIRYKEDVLLPWGYDGTVGTDYVYILTKKKVNEIYCKMAFPVTPAQQEEIDAHRKLWEDLRSAGINNLPGQPAVSPSPSTGGTEKPTTTDNGGLSTLGGVSSTTTNIISKTLNSGKKFMNLALSFVAWPFGSLFGNVLKQCVIGLGWFNLLLIIIIIIISYLWLRERRNNKKIESINKEIDLDRQ